MDEINDLELRLVLSVAAETVRQRLRSRDIGSSMTLEIKIHGEIQRGQLSLSYGIDCSSNRGSYVYANTLDAACDELLHRMGFDKRHAPLLLTANANQATSDPRTTEDDPVF